MICHFHISHNTPNVMPRRNQKQFLCILWGGGGEGGKRGVLWAMQKLANLLNVDDPVSCLIRAPAHHMLSIPVPL